MNTEVGKIYSLSLELEEILHEIGYQGYAKRRLGAGRFLRKLDGEDLDKLGRLVVLQSEIGGILLDVYEEYGRRKGIIELTGEREMKSTKVG